ncbi:unnamed protein product [Diabrotica balteata]|uniref:Cytochrome P450 n=1 Tax=Diabrotica balteata TaxID=107213 RepID=A0A9N9X5G7_DIABA|nr:unnamed protein product [Diabrotica balteata]
MLSLILLVIAIGLFYYVAIKPLNYWKEKRVIFQEGAMWLLGNQWKFFLNRQDMFEVFEDAYNAAPNARYVGFYQFTVPALMIRDPKLLKQITVKDFDHFVNHRTFVPEGSDPLWSKNLLSLRDQRWRDMRAVLSPSFTSSKMKMMFHLMADCSENLVKHFLTKDQETTEVAFKDVATRYANDIIASTAFGIRTDSFEKPKNEFYLMGKEITSFSSFWKNLKIVGFITIPKIFKLLKINIFDGPSRLFFINLIEDTLRMREEKNIVRPDMLNLLIEAKKGIQHKDEQSGIDETGYSTVQEHLTGKHMQASDITNEDITAHALIFFFGGFDSVSSTMCFAAHELATHPDIQTRLREEIDQGFEEGKGKMTYEVLMKMKYLDMVISECLRKWPNFPGIDRECSKEYVIQPESPDEEPLIVEKGSILVLPVMSIHHDPKYFPDPERFDPERFSDENKGKIKEYTYFPFGLGPRNCIGSRFALLEMKALFSYLLHHFEIVPIADTLIPPQLMKRNFNLMPIDGMRLGLKRL